MDEGKRRKYRRADCEFHLVLTYVMAKTADEKATKNEQIMKNTLLFDSTGTIMGMEI